MLVKLVRRMSGKGDLFALNFDNKALRTLPIDEIEENYVRSVSGACFSRVKVISSKIGPSRC